MLLNNYAIDRYNPGHSVGGQTNPIMWLKAGSLPMYYGGNASVSGETSKLGFPPGYLPPYSYALPPTSGGLSSHRNATVTTSQTGVAVGGKPASGSSTITFTPTATGGLIVSGTGSASITLSPTGTLISVAAGSGSSTITLSGTALIGALAGISGIGTVTLSPTATITAIGLLSGLSTNETEFSADALARAVWDAVAADFNLSGTMGEKLNAAGTAGDPWTADLTGYGTDTAGEKLRKALTVGKFLALK